MSLENQKIKSALFDGGYLSEKDISKGELFAQNHDVSLAEAVLSLGLINKDYLGKAIAEKLEINYSNIQNYAPDPQDVAKIPELISQKYKIVFLAESNDHEQVFVAATDPYQRGLNEELKHIFPGKKIAFVFAFPEDIEKFLVFYRKPLATRFAEIIKTQKRVAPEILEEIIEDAVTFSASDIHFEPRKNKLIIRFRINGVLYLAGIVPEEYYPNILNRIKIMANLRVDEHSRPQDGAIRYQQTINSLDIRVSIVPTLEGEKVAMRLLTRQISILSFSDLGLSHANQQQMSTAIRKPSGMIVVSGPTGSGKTTTLYTILNNLNSQEVNITTIEDPVEYRISGINQIQVNTQTNLTFADGLRSIIRQDPNIILVGEIRDRDTAKISVNAALTGHLMLSTFHAIDSATTISRLMYMDVEQSILASALELVISQRLVRKICEACRYSVSIDIKELKKTFPRAEEFFPKTKISLYQGKGCNACRGMGFVGRTAIFELLQVSRAMRELILKRPSAVEISDLAKKEGVKTFFEDGVEKVLAGVTSLPELLRVASPPEN